MSYLVIRADHRVCPFVPTEKGAEVDGSGKWSAPMRLSPTQLSADTLMQEDSVPPQTQRPETAVRPFEPDRMSRLISFAVLIAIIVLIGLLFYKVLIGFFIPVFLAAVLVVVFHPLHRWVLSKTGHRDQVAAVVTTVIIMLVLCLPIAFVTTASAVQGLRLIRENDAATIRLRFETIRNSLGLELPEYHGNLEQVEQAIASITDEIGRSIDVDPTATRYGNLEFHAKQAAGTLIDLRESVQQIEEGAAGREESFDELIDIAADIASGGDGEVSVSQLVVQLKSKFGTLKTELLGGPWMALARERANPSKEEIDHMISSVVSYAQPRLISFTGATGTYLVKLAFGSIILVVATFFFLYDGPAMIQSVMHLSPLDDSYEQELLLEFDRISRAVVLATLLSAIAQGVAAGIGYAVAGMEYLVLLTMLTTLFAMIPFVGPAVVWVPVCLYLGIYEERVLAASLLATWGVLVVGTVDNLVKAVVLHGQSQLHPLLALLSVLGGVQALGPIGIVVGPMVVAMLQTLLGILQRELLHFDRQNLVLSTEGISQAVPARRRNSKKRKQIVSAADDNGQSASSDASSQSAADAELDRDSDVPAEPSDEE